MPVRPEDVGLSSERLARIDAHLKNRYLDPAEELIVIFMTQLFPSQTFNFRDQLRAIIYPAIID